MQPSVFRSCRRWFSLVLLAAVVAALQGCGMIYKTTGDVLISYGKADMMSYVMSTGDVPMSCVMGLAQTPLLMSFQSVGSNPSKLAPLVYTTAATCSNAKALQAQLKYMRAMKEGNVNEAQDARIMQKRWSAISARRGLTAYNYTLKAFGDVSNGECPKLKSDFDQLAWMVGMISGLQALMYDTAAEGSVGVPRNIAANAAKGATCLDNTKWWGVPEGMRGVVWSMLPMLAPDNAKPWQMLQDAVNKGFNGGVRLSSTLYAMAAYSKGDTNRLKKAIQDFAQHDKNINPNYKMIDQIAKTMILGLSDRVWTQKTGKRTPFGQLGHFPNDKANEPKIDINSLLN